MKQLEFFKRYLFPNMILSGKEFDYISEIYNKIKKLRNWTFHLNDWTKANL